MDGIISIFDLLAKVFPQLEVRGAEDVERCGKLVLCVGGGGAVGVWGGSGKGVWMTTAGEDCCHRALLYSVRASWCVGGV